MTDSNTESTGTGGLSTPDIVITRKDKNPLIVNSRVMPAAGTFGYGDAYRKTIDVGKLGAVITTPISYEPRLPANGTRILNLNGGVLMHTGLPNPGIKQVIKLYENMWELLPVPVIVHLICTTFDSLQRSIEALEEVACVAAIELGFEDDIPAKEAKQFVRIATSNYDNPVLARVPLQDTFDIAEAVSDAGAGALVISAPPRGTARDPKNGRLVSGRIYGPLIKPLALRMVGAAARRIQNVPIIGAGGIHSLQDARDYLDAGAVAVQVDSVIWTNPRQLEYIARDLTGLTVTRESGALSDEWYEGMSSQTLRKLRSEWSSDGQ